MIGYIKGRVINKELPSELLVNVRDLGYIVLVNSSIFGQVQLEDEVELYTYHHIREDAQALYGFREKAHVRFFTKLIGVSGVGPKSALNIFEISDISSLMASIINEDVSLLTQVSGIGKKTAQRIVLELKNQLDIDSDQIGNISYASVRNPQQDVIDALVGLGYTTQQAQDSLKQIPDEVTDISEQIAYALKSI